MCQLLYHIYKFQNKKQKAAKFKQRIKNQTGQWGNNIISKIYIRANENFL